MGGVPLNRCTGHCCQRFPIMGKAFPRPGGGDAYGHDELDAIAENAIDGEYLADMLIAVYGPEPEDDQRAKWTCRHFDGRDCTAYEQRPQVCRDHGVTYACHTPNCTMDQKLVSIRSSFHQKRGTKRLGA